MFGDQNSHKICRVEVRYVTIVVWGGGGAASWGAHLAWGSMNAHARVYYESTQNT